MPQTSSRRPIAEMQDEFGVSVQEHLDIRARYSDDSMTQVRRRSRTTTTNWLYVYGIPTTPAELLQFADTVAEGLLSSLVVDGIVSIEAKALASDEEKQERAKEDAAFSQQSITDFLKHLAGNTDTPDNVVQFPGTGQYL